MKNELKEMLVSMGILETAITDKAHFIYDLGLDSLELTELMMMVEEKLKITIPNEAQDQIVRFEDLVKYVDEQLPITTN